MDRRTGAEPNQLTNRQFNQEQKHGGCMSINEIEVVRNEFGYWTHPDYPSYWDEDENLSEKYVADEVNDSYWNPKKPTDS